MYIYLKERQFYEDTYDRHTVEDARRDVVYYDKFYTEFESKLGKDETISRPGNAVILNAFYMQTVGLELLRRYENRDQYIKEWIAKDEAKDDQITTARLAEEPHCQHCGKEGLRIIDKSLMHRGDAYNIDDPDEVLFMLQCPHCEKNSAFWEDGEIWKTKPTLCPKCNIEVVQTTKRTKKVITFIYTCTVCKHSFKEKMDFSKVEEKPDPNFEKDRAHFCLYDKVFREHLFAIRKGFEDMAELGKEFKEKEDNKHIYDAVKEMKKPKIAELVPLLSSVLEKAGYIEFHLDKPEVGKDVFVGFSCLDSKSNREDYDSRNTLKKLIDQTLVDTMWRLMSNGISYRLGYLNGRLRAYEREEDLKNLVMKSGVHKPKRTSSKDDMDNNACRIKGKDGETIIL
jgi:hypothetical protein